MSLNIPGGTQISRLSAERIQHYLLECNANHEGAFATSRQSDAVLAEAHAPMADFLNAAHRVPRSKSFPYRSHLNKRDLAHHQSGLWLS